MGPEPYRAWANVSLDFGAPAVTTNRGVPKRIAVYCGRWQAGLVRLWKDNDGDRWSRPLPCRRMGPEGMEGSSYLVLRKTVNVTFVCGMRPSPVRQSTNH